MLENLKKLVSYYKPYKKVFLADMFFAIMASFIALLIPLVVRYVTAKVIYMPAEQAIVDQHMDFPEVFCCFPDNTDSVLGLSYITGIPGIGNTCIPECSGTFRIKGFTAWSHDSNLITVYPQFPRNGQTNPPACSCYKCCLHIRLPPIS